MKFFCCILAGLAFTGCVQKYSHNQRPDRTNAVHLSKPNYCDENDIERISPYTANPKTGPFAGIPGRVLPEEMQLSWCDSGPCRPFTSFQFKNFVAEQARDFQAENVRFELAGDQYYHAETAILERVKVGLADRSRPPQTETWYFTHLTFRTIPCGTWQTFPK